MKVCSEQEGLLSSPERFVRCAVLVLVPALLGACGAGLSNSGLGTIAEYKASNIIAPVGYEDTILSDTQTAVAATGTDITPFERLEKIATARAAELGVTKKQAFFKVTGLTRDVKCTKKKSRTKVPDVEASVWPTVRLEAVYSPSQMDGSYLSTRETFERLKAELAAETVPADAMQAAAADARARCAS